MWYRQNGLGRRPKKKRRNTRWIRLKIGCTETTQEGLNVNPAQNDRSEVKYFPSGIYEGNWTLIRKFESGFLKFGRNSRDRHHREFRESIRGWFHVLIPQYGSRTNLGMFPNKIASIFFSARPSSKSPAGISGQIPHDCESCAADY